MQAPRVVRASSYKGDIVLKAKLLYWKELAPEVHHLEFEATDRKELLFTPGQYISVPEKVNGKQIVRAYSIASPRDRNQFALCLNRVPDSFGLSCLFTLQPGEEVEMHEPLGHFTLKEHNRRAVFVAAGTGIAPFRSMLLDHLPKIQAPITLLFGARHENDLLYREEMEELSARFKTFRFLPTLTRPGNTWEGLTGRVQNHLDEVLTSGGVHNEDTDVYICGLKTMVDDVRGKLERNGFPRGRIIYEKYD